MLMMMMSRNILSISGSSSSSPYYYYLVVLLLSSFPSPVVSDFLYDPSCGIVGVAQVSFAMFGLKDCIFFTVMDVCRIILWVCTVFLIISDTHDEKNKLTLRDKVLFYCFAILYATFFEIFTALSIVAGGMFGFVMCR